MMVRVRVIVRPRVFGMMGMPVGMNDIPMPMRVRMMNVRMIAMTVRNTVEQAHASPRAAANRYDECKANHHQQSYPRGISRSNNAV